MQLKTTHGLTKIREQTGTNVPWRHCFHRDHHQFIIIVSCTHQARPCDCKTHIWVDSKVTNQTLKVISVEGSTLWGLPEGHLHNFRQVLKVNIHETLDYQTFGIGHGLNQEGILWAKLHLSFSLTKYSESCRVPSLILVKETESENNKKGKKTKRQRDKKAKRQKYKETKRQKKRQKDKRCKGSFALLQCLYMGWGFPYVVSSLLPIRMDTSWLVKTQI